MIRVKISGFIKRNKEKIQDLLTKLIMVAIVIFIATIMIRAFRSNNMKDAEETEEVYRPTETVIKGSNVSKEQYEIDSNIVNNFLNYCNNGQIEEAYALLTDDCKNELYPTLEDFQKYYYNAIFEKNREFNLQSWISTKNYTVYKVRYTDNLMVTGKYNEDDIYQDYITLNKKANIERISIGKLVACEYKNIIVKTTEIEASVLKKKIYISDEEYEIKIKNNTNKTMLLSKSINLVDRYGTTYGAYTNLIFDRNLILNPGETKTLNIKFKKGLSSNNKSSKISFSNINIQNEENQTDKIDMTIKLED